MVKKLRLSKGWSQEDLANFSGLSVKSIQRAEQGKKVGIETLKSLASVFEIDFNQLAEQQNMRFEDKLNQEEKELLEEIRTKKDFYLHLINFCIVMTAIFAINYIFMSAYIWAWWVLLGWGIGLSTHAIQAFGTRGIFSKNWEKKQLEKKLGRKL